jgi:hypothetical protein
MYRNNFLALQIWPFFLVLFASRPGPSRRIAVCQNIFIVGERSTLDFVGSYPVMSFACVWKLRNVQSTFHFLFCIFNPGPTVHLTSGEGVMYCVQISWNANTAGRIDTGKKLNRAGSTTSINTPNLNQDLIYIGPVRNVCLIFQVSVLKWIEHFRVEALSDGESFRCYHWHSHFSCRRDSAVDSKPLNRQFR